MRSTAIRLLALGVCLLGAGCERTDGAISAMEPAPERAPDVSWRQGGDDVTLASLRGHTVLLHFADAASPTWEALEEAFPDLDAEGATVVGIVTRGSLDHASFETTTDDALARSFDVDEMPTAIVVDADGWIRGRSTVTNADALFALAAPVLLEEDVNTPVSVPEADAARLDTDDLARLVRAGAALIDTRTDAERETEGWVPLALPRAMASLSPRDLPADLSATLVFLGPEAKRAAQHAEDWGYTSLVVLPDVSGYTVTPEAPPSAAPAPLLSPSGRRSVVG